MATYQDQVNGFNYVIFDGFDGGLQTTVESNKIPDNASPAMSNIVFDGGNSFQPRRGTSAIGETSANYGGIKSMYNFKKSDGNEYMMRSYDTVMEYFNPATSSWTNIISTSSSGRTFGYATYSIDDQVYFGNGADIGYRWSGTSANSTSSVARGNIYLTHESRLFVSGLSAAPNSIYYSKSGDPLDFTGVISATAGQGGVQKFGSQGDRIVSLTHFDEKIYVGKQDTLWTFEFNLDYGSLSETPIAKELITAEAIGPTYNLSTQVVDNFVSWITKNKKIKNYGTVETSNRLQLLNLSDKIERTIDNLNFATATSIYFDRKLYIACRSNSSSYNDTVLVYDFKYNAWTKFTGWNVGDWVIWRGNLYYGDSSMTKVYKALSGANDNGGNIATSWKSKEIDFGFPEIRKEGSELYIEGYITANTTITVKVYYDGNTSSPVLTKTITGTSASVDSSLSINFGDRVFGELPYGGSVPTTVAGNKFRQKFELTGEDFHTGQIEITTDGDGQQYRITHLGFYVRLADERVFKVTALN